MPWYHGGMQSSITQTQGGEPCTPEAKTTVRKARRFSFHWGAKDGGPDSHVYAWGLEVKSWFSILVLRFGHGSRDAYHSHAFHAVSWLLSGMLREFFLGRTWPRLHWAGWRPIATRRQDWHQVHSVGTSWVLTFRGPWAQTWDEFTSDGTYLLLGHGREVRAQYPDPGA